MFLQLFISGLCFGSLYALIALAMVIIYKTSEVPNFGQGEMAMISTFVAYTLLVSYSRSFTVSFIGALVFAALLGVFLERCDFEFTASLCRRSQASNQYAQARTVNKIHRAQVNQYFYFLGIDHRRHGIF